MRVSIVTGRGVVALGIVPLISASRRSRRARRCNAVPATGTRDYTNQYFLHISRVFPNWPAARATPLDTAMPRRFYHCLPGKRISIESGGCATFLVFQIKTPLPTVDSPVSPGKKQPRTTRVGEKNSLFIERTGAVIRSSSVPFLDHYRAIFSWHAAHLFGTLGMIMVIEYSPFYAHLQSIRILSLRKSGIS